MKHETVTAQIHEDRSPLFIVDQDGIFIGNFSELLSLEFLPIVLTRQNIPDDRYPHVVIIQQRSRFPKIPDNLFKSIFVVEGENDIRFDFYSALFREAKKRSIPSYFFFYDCRGVIK